MPITEAPPPDSDNAHSLNPQLIEFLEELLAEARDGSIRSVAVAIEHMDGTTSDRWANGMYAYTVRLLGAAQLMQHRLAKRIVEGEM